MSLRTLPLVLALAACGGEPEWEKSGCDPLDPNLCALPWPSSYFMEEADSPSGYQVHFFETSLPENRDDVQTRPDFINEKDGFSTNGSALVYFDDVSLDGVVRHDDIGASLAADSKTIVLNAETGELHPHYVELDVSAEDPSEQLLMIRPAVPFEHGTRYIVGIRGLQKNAGGSVDVSEAFRKLRDDEESQNGDIEVRREHFEDNVFAPLEAAGWTRGDLQLAWDFVTVSRENSLGKMDRIRELLYEEMGESGPEYTISSVETGNCEAGDRIALTLEGLMTVPLYTQKDDVRTLLNDDADGMPYAEGTTDKEFLVRVPCSVVANDEPAMVLQYGHGLLGDRGEARTGWLSDLANREGFIVVATDWTGMSEEDAPHIALMLVDDVTNFPEIPERSHQGFAEFHALSLLVKHRLASDENLQGTGGSLVDPDNLVYYGNSQGAILGAAFMAQSLEIERGVLGVGGGPYEILLTRSHDFDPFFLLFKEKFTDHRDITMLISVMQTLWDPAEGAGYLHDLKESPDGVPQKQLLMQVGVHDSQVNTLGAQFEARATGMSMVTPETRSVWGLTAEAPGFTGSAYVEYDYPDTPEEPLENIPPNGDFDTHECPRREPAAQQQLMDFLRTGVINHYCDGICDDSLQADRCG
ncbi:MAG: hypothetical protein EP330_14980 [Deltaproteobacteria bacterium]|nr:MAG: hypothetical protein EP330_14980 [Deltaproteobacteria bacterium]